MAEAIAVVRVIHGLSSAPTVRCGTDEGDVVVVDSNKSRTFSADFVFTAEEDQSSVASAVIEAVDLGSLLAEGRNLAVITYGPRDSGKSSLLFSESEGLLAGLITEMIAATGKLTITGSEVVYAEKASAEVWVDLLNPGNENPVKVRVGAVVESEEEAWEVVRIAQKHASSWRSSPDSSAPQLLNSRGHTLLTLTCNSSQVRVSLLDLAGFQSSHPSPSLQGKLPSDQQLMFTRMGLLQLRSFIRNVAEGRSVEANHRFKVVTAAESIIRGAKVVFAVCLRADCAPSDAVNALELMETVKLISADEVQSGEEVTEVAKSFTEITEYPLLRKFGTVRVPLSPHSAASRPLEDSPLKHVSSFHTNTAQGPMSQSELNDQSENEKSEETKDWISQFDARLSRILSRSGKATPKKSATESSSNLRVTIESFQGSPRSLDASDSMVTRLREDCRALESQSQEHTEESAALQRHITALEIELHVLKREVAAQLQLAQRESEALAAELSAGMEAQGGTQLQEVYSKELELVEERVKKVQLHAESVRTLAEEMSGERVEIRTMKALVSEMMGESQSAQEELMALQAASRKWDMAEKCYSNVCRHIRDLDAELAAIAGKMKKQESKAERLMAELLAEKKKNEHLLKTVGEARMEGSKLVLATARQRNVIALRATSTNVTVSTDAGAGNIAKSVRFLQDALRQCDNLQEMELASQLLQHVQTLTEELRKRKIRTRNMSAKVKRLQGSPKHARKSGKDHSSLNSSESKLPKFSFS